MDAILRLADVPHSVISTSSYPPANEQQRQLLQPAQARVEHQRSPRGPRRRISGSNHRRSVIRPLSSDAHTHLRTAVAVRSATMSPVTGSSSRHSFMVERTTQTLDRLERTASDFDVRLFADKSTTLPKSDGRGIPHRHGFPGGKGGNASDGDEIDATPTRLSGKKRTRFRFKNPFRSTDKSSDATKLSGRKTAGRKMFENCM